MMAAVEKRNIDVGALIEMAQFLTESSRADLREIALQYIAGVSATADVTSVFLSSDSLILNRLFKLLCSEHTSKKEKKHILTALVNGSAVIELRDEYVKSELVLKTATDALVPGRENLEFYAQLLSNLTVLSRHCEQVIRSLNIGVFLQQAVEFLAIQEECGTNFYEYMGYIVRNLSQLKPVRKLLVEAGEDKKHSKLSWLYATLKFSDREPRRVVVADIIRNCCFDTGDIVIEYHESLISNDELLVSLLYPLTGPEELCESENDELPIDLQYMEAEKKRDASEAVRCKLLESLYQLCSTSKGREYLRDKGTYYILRELHKVEIDRNCQKICENVIGVLIRTEADVGFGNLKEIPEKDI